MTNRLIRLMRVLAVGGLLLTTLVFTLSAYADDTDPSKPTSIEFMDKGKLTVDLKWLMDKPESEKGKLPIWIHNSTTGTQKVRLSLEGCVPTLSTAPYAGKLEDMCPSFEEQELAPGATDPITLDFKAFTTAVFSETVSFPGFLVATSDPGGDVIRREFELKVEVKKDEPPKAIGLDDLPKDLEGLTFPGTNYLPSIFNPLYPAVSWSVVAILLFLLARRLSWETLTKGTKTLGWIFVGLVVVVVMALAVGWITKQVGTGPEWGMVVVNPIKVPVSAELKTAEEEEPEGEEHAAAELASAPAPTPTPTHGTPVGVVTADDRVATAVKHDDRLEIVGITRAGKYGSKIDLLPDDDEKTTETFTVNVADWWPFAFLTIALGVLVGYRLTQYYERERSAMEQRVRAARLWQEIVEEESGFQEKHAGRPYAAYSIVKLAREWINRVEEKLSDGDIDSAKTLLGKLDTYANLFVVFQQCGTKKLYDLQDRLRQQFKKRNFGLASVDDVEALQRTKVLVIGTPFSFPIEDEEGRDLKEKKKNMEQAVAWVEELVDTLDDIDRWIDYAEGLTTADGRTWSQEVVDGLRGLLTSTRNNAIQALQNELDTGALNKQIDALKSAGGKALLATKKEDVQAQRKEATKAHYKIVELAKKAATDAAAKATAPTGVALFMWDETKRALGVVVEESTGERKIEVPAPPKVSCTVWALDGQTGTDCRADSDDLFAFTASITFSAPLLTDYDVQWDFGDGATSCVITIPKNTTGSKRLETSHQFRVGGARKVQLMALKDGVSTPLGEGCDVLVKPRPGRLEQRQATFRLSDLHMTVVSGLLAVGTGLSALYTSTWGAPSDYLKAFLWGSVVSEATKAGAKVVRDLAKGKWPMGA